MEETTVQRPPIDRKNGRVGSSRRTTSNPMLPAECQTEEHSHATGTPYESEHELVGERLSRKVSIRVEVKAEIP